MHVSQHTEEVKGKCQPIASQLAASGPIPANSDHLLCQVYVWLLQTRVFGGPNYVRHNEV